MFVTRLVLFDQLFSRINASLSLSVTNVSRFGDPPHQKLHLRTLIDRRESSCVLGRASSWPCRRKSPSWSVFQQVDPGRAASCGRFFVDQRGTAMALPRVIPRPRYIATLDAASANRTGDPPQLLFPRNRVARAMRDHEPGPTICRLLLCGLPVPRFTSSYLVFKHFSRSLSWAGFSPLVFYPTGRLSVLLRHRDSLAAHSDTVSSWSLSYRPSGSPYAWPRNP